ncbi:hypothetical protein BDV40DRAFT_257232 [Aspergillus tamarii]|uniref:Secreted protein n=1 Tax=Aspergillus tamarii TaxID=41984 RepID=A0A5N6V7R8_ASPTM|nr:hypothetical protein BDV40DRAFT_257232 [Aspergillus tamarii]
MHLALAALTVLLFLYQVRLLRLFQGMCGGSSHCFLQNIHCTDYMRSTMYFGYVSRSLVSLKNHVELVRIRSLGGMRWC